MKYQLILLILLFGCGSRQKLSNTKELLSGAWINVGLYKNGTPDYDTLGWKFTDKFDGTISEMKTVIWTDSGTFEHVYSTENNELLRIDSVKYLTISEFEFNSDSSGVLYTYEVDTSNYNTLESRDYAQSEEFRLIQSGDKMSLKFKLPNDITYTTVIRELSLESLILEFNTFSTSRYKKLNMQDTSLPKD